MSKNESEHIETADANIRLTRVSFRNSPGAQTMSSGHGRYVDAHSENGVLKLLWRISAASGIPRQLWRENKSDPPENAS